MRPRSAAQTVCHAVYRDDPRGYSDGVMSIPFHPQHGLVIVQAVVEGPSGKCRVTAGSRDGVHRPVINVGMRVALGYDPALVPERIQSLTGSGVEFVPCVSLHTIGALARTHELSVLGHTSPSTSIDGVLGLDFVRGHTLTNRFPHGHDHAHRISGRTRRSSAHQDGPGWEVGAQGLASRPAEQRLELPQIISLRCLLPASGRGCSRSVRRTSSTQEKTECLG